MSSFSFFKSPNERDIFGICFDLVPKSLYSFSKSEKKCLLIQYLYSLKDIWKNLMVC